MVIYISLFPHYILEVFCHHLFTGTRETDGYQGYTCLDYVSDWVHQQKAYDYTCFCNMYIEKKYGCDIRNSEVLCFMVVKKGNCVI